MTNDQIRQLLEDVIANSLNSKDKFSPHHHIIDVDVYKFNPLDPIPFKKNAKKCIGGAIIESIYHLYGPEDARRNSEPYNEAISALAQTLGVTDARPFEARKTVRIHSQNVGYEGTCALLHETISRLQN